MPGGMNVERVSAIGIMEKRILLRLLQQDSLIFSELIEGDDPIMHRPSVANALNALESRGYTEAPERKGRRRRPHKLTDKGFLAALALPEVWTTNGITNKILDAHPSKFLWFNKFGYLHSKGILPQILLMFRHRIANFDVEAFPSPILKSESCAYPEAFENYPDADPEVTQTVYDDITAQVFGLTALKGLDKEHAFWLSDIICSLMDDPELRLFVKKSLLYEMEKNLKEFQRLEWWTDFLNQQMNASKQTVDSYL